VFSRDHLRRGVSRTCQEFETKALAFTLRRNVNLTKIKIIRPVRAFVGRELAFFVAVRLQRLATRIRAFLVVLHTTLVVVT
jgi:hypothetical protein